MVKPGYKQTEMGVIPEDWDVAPLGDISCFHDSKRVPIRESDRVKMHGDYPYYGASGIIDYVNDYIFDGDYILLGEDGANIIDRSSRLAFVVSGKCWINNHAHVIEPHESMNIYFLSEYLESITYDEYNTGTAQPKLNREKCNMIPVPVPSLVEQLQIAKVLEDCDSLIVTLEKEIVKKNAIKQGAMQELLTGKKRLPGFDGKWKKEKLPEVLQKNAGIKIGPFGSQLKKEYLLEDGPFRVYGQENVFTKDFAVGNRRLNRERFEQLQSCEICEGDFLISTMGTIGKCAIVPNGICRGIMDSHLVRLRIDQQKILSHYLLHLFSEELGYLKSQTSKLSVGGIMDGLSTKIINSLVIYYPEDLIEQRTVAEMLSNMDEAMDVLKQKLDKYRQVKQGMMQQLLTGKIRLV